MEQHSLAGYRGGSYLSELIMNLKWQYLKLRQRLIHTLCSRLYRDTDRDICRSIMVAGTARSGTTWLANIIASQIPCRLMFEPFQSRMVEAFSQFYYFHYMRPSEQNNELWSYCRKIFTGDIRHDWVDRKVESIFPKYRLIKEIRANLFLQWIHRMFPEVPLLFIIRHPCAVILSRMQLAWATDTDIETFLSQSKLIDDFLANKIDIIRGAKTVEEKHAIIWSITNLVPLKQFGPNGLNVIFYENLSLQPEVEIPKIFQIIPHDYQDSVFEVIEKPSTTTVQSSAIITGDNKITRWKKELSPQQIDNILSIVADFELDHIYGDSFIPLVTAL
jgi:hypothetical protein